jgi:hypothetical protein
MISICFYLGTALTALNLVGNYEGPPLMAGLMSFLYPLIQPLSRLLIGIWL